VVEEAPAPEAAIRAAERPLHLLTLSARDDRGAGRVLRAATADFLATHPELDLGSDLHEPCGAQPLQPPAERRGRVGRLNCVEDWTQADSSEQAAARCRCSTARDPADRLPLHRTGRTVQPAWGGSSTTPSLCSGRAIDRCAALLDGQLEAPLLELLGYTGGSSGAAHRPHREHPAGPLRPGVCPGDSSGAAGVSSRRSSSATAWASWPQPAWLGSSAWRTGSRWWRRAGG
jgi:hypothetical protein